MDIEKPHKNIPMKRRVTLRFSPFLDVILPQMSKKVLVLILREQKNRQKTPYNWAFYCIYVQIRVTSRSWMIKA